MDMMEKWICSNSGKCKKPSELRNLASVLGDAYKEDKNSSLNSGYPILTWQQ